MTSTYTETTILPNATLQAGAASNTVVGAANAHTALSTSGTSAYLRLGAQARLDDKVTRVQFPTPSLPSGARVFGVEVKVTLRVGAGTGFGYAVLLLWLRSLSGPTVLAGQQQLPKKLPISLARPIAGSSDWQVDLSLGVYPSGPDDRPWNTATNLNQICVDLGRDDVLPVTVDVATLSLVVQYQEKATVTVTGPANGSATSPPATWSVTAPLNQAPQTGYRVAINTLAETQAANFTPFVTPAQYITGVPGESAAKSWWLTGDVGQWAMPDGAVFVDGTYVAFVQVATRWAGAGGDFFSDIASAQWTRSGAGANPPGPGVMQSATHNYNAMQVELVYLPAAGTTFYTVQHSLTGQTWESDPSQRLVPVTTGTDPITITHRFYATSVPNLYRVVAFKGTPLVAAQQASNVLSVTPLDGRYVMRSPTNPLLDCFIEPMSDGEGGLEVVHMQQQGLHRTVGVGGQRQLPLMQWGADQGDQYELNLWFDSLRNPQQVAAFDQLSRQPSPAFWQHPDGRAYWVGIGPGGDGRPTKDRYQPLLGKPAKEHWRKREVTFTELEKPAYY